MSATLGFKPFRFVALILTLLSSIWVSSTAYAQSTGWLQDPNHPPVMLRVMTTGQVDKEAKTIEAVLDVKLSGEWKTYWRSPGEGGVAPELDWSQSENIADIEWHWPVPAYYEQLGVMTLGYKHNVSFPITLRVEDINQPVILRANLRLPSCTNICVITDYDVSLTLDPTDLTLDEDAAFLYTQGMSLTPKHNGMVEAQANYWDQANQTLTVKLTTNQKWEKPQILVDGDDVVDEYFAEPKIAYDGNELYAKFKVSNWLGEADLAGKSVTLTVSDASILSEVSTDISTTPLNMPSQTNFIWMVGFALLGGLILNIMPCVLPVLGMKLNSLLHSQDMEPRQIRLSFLASALGIITSFAILAGGLTLLKLGGNAIGWGIQFQNMWFIGFMVLVTLVFAINLLGLIEFRLPSGMNTWMATKGNNSHSGHFIQGMFATLLATPCSAPFLGTAVAYALGASYAEMWAIFIALGVGMSAPWLLFTAMPQLVKFLPKPGNWMNTVKTVFGVMMLITSLWLISLMKPFVGQMVSILAVIGVLLAVLIWIGLKHGKKVVIAILAVVTFAFGGGLIIGSLTADKWSTPIVDDLPWQKLDAEQIPELVAQGKTVFVDVTADWCITCKANKIGVILQNPVYDRLNTGDIVLMRGDWTTPSDSVTKYLQSNDRFGVPFNIVYGPKYPNGIPLPVILNSDVVMDAIKLAE
ncbi:protein-disulfide reductase DsbD family protein [Vibrio paucivorans]